MKSKNQIKIIKGTTHVSIIDAAGKSGKMLLKAFVTITQGELEQMGEKVEFIAGTGKRAKVLGETVIAKSGEVEAIASAICEDAARVTGETDKPAQVIDITGTAETMPDELTTSTGTWNSNDTAPIALRSERNILNRFEYVPTALMAGTFDTGYKILSCSDTGKIVGKPFADSYGLVNNAAFNNVIEAILTVCDKMGLKPSIATTGTLMFRERSFISLSFADNSAFKIGDREFQAFLNCLNSIPSNSGCTVTFANNTFCVCCRNTFAHALRNTDETKFHAAIKHTKSVNAALQDIPRLVEAYLSGNAKLFKQLGAFSVVPISLIDAENYFAAFIGRDLKGELSDKSKLSTRSANIVETLKGLFSKGRGNKGETALDLFSAVTEYYTHFSAGESDDKLKQYTSSEAGAGATAKGEFYSWLVQSLQDKSRFSAVAKVGDTLLVNYRNAAK